MSRRIVRRVVVAVALLAAAGCGIPTRPDDLVSPEDRALVRGYFDAVRGRRVDEIERAADPSISGPGLRRVVERAAAAIPIGEPTSATLVGANVLRAPDAVTASITYEYGFDGGWVVAQFTIGKQAGGVSLLGFHIVPNPAPLAERHAFRLTDRSPAQWLILGLALALPVFTVYTLVSCARAGLRGWQWLWLPFVAVGVGWVAVNWTTGVVTVFPLYVQLFSASAVRDLNGPWVISVSFPLGAVWFLRNRRHRRRAAPGGESSVAGRVESGPNLPTGAGESEASQAGDRCPKCGAVLPVVPDAYCPECRQALRD